MVFSFIFEPSFGFEEFLFYLLSLTESRLEGGVNRANLKFTNLITTTSRVSVRNMNESERGGENKSRANKE